MQLQVDIGFNQLVQLVKKLSPRQWTKLKQEIENEQTADSTISELEAFLLNAPAFSEKQLDAIAEIRKTINGGRNNAG